MRLRLNVCGGAHWLFCQLGHRVRPAALHRDRPPTAQVRSEFGQPDATPYERIEVETLLVAGAQDKLRLPGYAQELAGRIPRSQLAIVSDAGHCPNVETAAEVAPLISDFLCP